MGSIKYVFLLLITLGLLLTTGPTIISLVLITLILALSKEIRK